MAHKRKISTTPLDYAAALNDLEGYPSDPTHRGSACPPAPFGRTLGYQLVLFEGDESQVVVVSQTVLDEHDGKTVDGVTIQSDLGDPFDRAPAAVGGGGRGERGQT